MVDLSSEAMQGKEEWSQIFEVLKEKKYHQPRILCLVKLSFKNEREILSLTNKNGEFITNRSNLQ